MITKMETESLEDYRRYFAELRGAEHAKDELIQRLLRRLGLLEEQYNQKNMDYDREVQFNRQGQVKEAQMQLQIKELQIEGQYDPFILVLLDSDGMIFDDAILERGESGGRDAANELWAQTREYVLRELQHIPQHFKIVTRAYANLKGLGVACYQSGVLTRSSLIEDFARGFTGSKQLFDFVDVGSGKDRADEKITETLKLHLNSRSCHHIILGASHDNGYARLLEDIDPKSKSKITLLEGVPFERELRSIAADFETTKFGNLFRRTKIVVPPQPLHRAGTNGSELSDRGYDLATRSYESKPYTNGNGGSVNGSSSSSASPRPVAAQAAVANNGPSTWAKTVTRAPSPPSPSHSNHTAHDEPEIPRNRKGQRIDATVVGPDPQERMRVARIKMCNVHYLQRACPYGEGCTHDHKYRPNPAELAILRYMNRIIPCRNGTGCEESKCMYGHRCQRPVEGTSKKCRFGNDCRFSTEMHGIDTRIVKTTTV